MPWSGIFVLFRWDGPIRNLRVFVTVSSPLGAGKMTDEAAPLPFLAGKERTVIHHLKQPSLIGLRNNYGNS